MLIEITPDASGAISLGNDMNENKTGPNHALHRMAAGCRGCNRGVPCAGSLSLGRYAMRRIRDRVDDTTGI